MVAGGREDGQMALRDPSVAGSVGDAWESVGAEVRSALEVAYRAAVHVREQAEESELTEGLMRRAVSVARESDRLISVLQQATRSLNGSGNGGWSPSVAASTGAPARAEMHGGGGEGQGVEPSLEGARRRESLRRAGTDSEFAREEARLAATQMAAAGSERAEIERRIREDFGVGDTAAILDEIGV